MFDSSWGRYILFPAPNFFEALPQKNNPHPSTNFLNYYNNSKNKQALKKNKKNIILRIGPSLD